MRMLSSAVAGLVRDSFEWGMVNCAPAPVCRLRPRGPIRFCWYAHGKKPFGEANEEISLEVGVDQGVSIAN